MKTIGFLGSDKNAGKTTVLRFIANRLRSEGHQLILCSIGINGEAHDSYEGTSKPEIQVEKGDLFVTSPNNLLGSIGTYQILYRLEPPEFPKSYCICRALMPTNIVLEGPNSRTTLSRMKAIIGGLITGPCFLLLDGSIDRQFMGHPALCDSFYFSLLITNRVSQQTKAQQLLRPLQLPVANDRTHAYITKYLCEETRYMLFTHEGKLLHHGFDPPFMDPSLKASLTQFPNQIVVLYLAGALTKGLSDFLSPFKRLTIILDNFTQYLRVFVQDKNRQFHPRLELLHPFTLRGIFLKEDGSNKLSLPSGIPVFNLFREDHHVIRIPH